MRHIAAEGECAVCPELAIAMQTRFGIVVTPSSFNAGASPSAATHDATDEETSMGRIERRALIALALIVLAQPARTQDYPARPVTLVAPYAAGGGADLLARLMAQKLGERLAQSFVVEDRLGAGGVIAASSVAKSAPDGYTLFLATSTQLAIQTTLHRKLPYDPAADFAPIALIASAPFVLIVHPSLGVGSLADLIKLARERPGQLSFGSSGVGGPPHLYTELLKSMTGVEMTHVPYKGTAQAINDLVAGSIPIIFCDLAPAVPLIRDGKVRALGISSAKRFVTLPEVPTIAEAGVPGFDAVAWLMLVAPANTPRAVVDALHAQAKSIVASPQVRQQFIDLGMMAIDSPPPAELTLYVQSEMVRWGKVVRQAGLAGSQ
jgi:tripartite-type tricarboxylate transporter receptor subunit TctC